MKLTESKGLKILNEARNFYTLSNGNTYTGNALDYFVENKIFIFRFIILDKDI